MTPIMWSTPIETKNFTKKLHHDDSFLTIGSCFAENIGSQLVKRKIKTVINPLDISYNPISLSNQLKYLSGDKVIDQEKIGVQDGVFFHDDFHSNFNALTKSELLKNLKSAITFDQNLLKTSRTIIISLGTAWVHRSIKTKEIVNNCHKQPAQLFSKELLSLENVTNAFSTFCQTFTNTHIIFTVSPIRHMKEGFSNNQLSKATLRLAINLLEKSFENVSYFPSYEIMLDELRDYRFYDKDLLHPSQEAVDYIFDSFIQRCFEQDSMHYFEEIGRLLRDVNHKPLLPGQAKHQVFIKKTLIKLDAFSDKYPNVSFARERENLESQLV